LPKILYIYLESGLKKINNYMHLFKLGYILYILFFLYILNFNQSLLHFLL